ncbi:MAG: KH domain-containing protein [Anaerolineales bacterium]|nr:KH domain-containing protein [Anaerolineales bacterium]
MTDDTLTQDLALAESTLKDLLGFLSDDATVAARIGAPDEPDDPGAPTPLELDVQGGDLGFLIGHRGEALSSLQYLVRALLAKQLKRNVHVVIDVDSYRVKRREQLMAMARRIAEQVAQRGKPMSLEPMAPDERRTIHIALRDHPAVRTESVGEGNRRKVTIIPR